MDLDIIQSTKEGEITQFLCDVRDYFKASLATSEYENTSNMFFLTASESTEQLLSRCECLLNRLNIKNSTLPPNTSVNGDFNNTFSSSQNTQIKSHESHNTHRNDKSEDNTNAKQKIINEEVSYLDMSASQYDRENQQISIGKMIKLNSSGENEKTFRCSTLVVKQNRSFLHSLHDTIMTTTRTPLDEDESEQEVKEKSAYYKNQDRYNNFVDDDTQIYDICQVTTQGSEGEEDELGIEETQKAITPQSSHLSLPNIDCPFIDLPAGHLSIKKSIKYGQLLKIEKRLFFDQSKKCYCGILDDWLLCYADGPTSNKPTISLYLKIPSIEIEHFGEGKRREICFQITTCDPNKRFVFQAINEIDAKEWIHAIESSIRSDIADTEVRSSSTRKLPTPPIMKKVTFLDFFQAGTETLSSNTTSCDGIYEEPSPINEIIIPKSCSEMRPQLPHKQNNSLQLVNTFEYDIPKCPPQPFKENAGNEALLINPYENNETNLLDKNHTVINVSDSSSQISSSPITQKLNLKMEENLDFQAKVKDVHSKLTSQLLNGPNIKKSVKKSLSSTSSQNSPEIHSLPNSNSTVPDTAELKKLKKTSAPSNTPQKNSIEKSSFAKNWFLNRLNKTTSSTKSNSSSPSNSPSKSKQSEKENLLNSASDICDGYDMHSTSLINKPVSSPISKSSSPSSGTSKVNMIINQLEASGHLTTMFNVDPATSFNSFYDNDFNNYEPIVTVSTPPTNLMKKV